MMYMEQGQLDTARAKLMEVAETPSATREVFYSLGEIERARDKADEAMKYYQRAADMDANWAKPLVGLALSAIQKGDIPTRDQAPREGRRPREPTRSIRRTAKAMLDQLKK